MSVPPVRSTDLPKQSPPEGNKAEVPVKKDVGVQTDEVKQAGNTEDHFYREFWNSEEGRKLLIDCRAAWSKTNLDTNDA